MTSGVGQKTATAAPTTAPATGGMKLPVSAPPVRRRGARKMAEASRSASTVSIADAGRPFSPKQPQPLVSATVMPSFIAVVTIA